MKNLGQAFTFPFKDPDWIAKLTIGSFFTLLSLFLVGIPVLYGYYLDLVRRVRRGDPNPLPEWKDVGVKFISGCKYLVTLWIYYVPLIIVFLPVVLMLLLTSAAGSHLEAQLGRAAFVGMLIFVVVPYALAVQLLTPVITILFAEEEKIREGLNIGRVVRLFGGCWQDCLIVLAISLATEIASSLGFLLFVIGILFTSFYVTLVRFHMIGQIGSTIPQQEAVA